MLGFKSVGKIIHYFDRCDFFIDFNEKGKEKIWHKLKTNKDKATRVATRVWANRAAAKSATAARASAAKAVRKARDKADKRRPAAFRAAETSEVRNK